MNKVADLEVQVMQSNHVIKWLVVIVTIINIIMSMTSAVFTLWQTAAMNERVEQLNETLQNVTEKLNDPSFGDLVGTVIDGMIGICSSLAYYWKTSAT